MERCLSGMHHISRARSLQQERIERVAVFIDGANLYAASRTLGFDVDYKNLLAHFRQRSYLVRAYYYTALLETEEYSPLRPLVDWLGYNSYAVVTKPYLLIPGVGLSSLGGIDEALDVTTEFLIQARDGS